MNQSLKTHSGVPSKAAAHFNKTAGRVQPKNKENSSSRPAPFSIRLTQEERAYLEAKAGNQALGAYIRQTLLGDQQASRRKLRKPKVDDEKAAAILSELGSSRIPANLNQLAKAANTGTLDVQEETEQQLQHACAAVIAMREALFIALGLKTGGSS